MVIRDGLVTNSSSSSYIVAFKNSDIDFERLGFTVITLDNVLDFYVDCAYDPDLCYGRTNDEIKELLSIDDRMIKLLIVVQGDFFSDYLTTLEKLKKYSDYVVVKCSYDNGYEPDDFWKILENGELLVKYDWS